MHILMTVTFLFLVPIYYAARSKGRSSAGYIVAALLLPFAIYPLAEWLPPVVLALGWLIFPLAVLGLVLLLPRRRGAPGAAYLKITFTCPECKAAVTFGREREGFAELCPTCGEMITVPRDQYTPQPERRDWTRPQGMGSEACIESFGREELAYLTQTILADNGVPARVAGDDGGGTIPTGAARGYRVLIDANDWDRAVEVLKQVRTADGGDAAPPEAPPGTDGKAPS